jgi:hypothetical protein
MDGYLDDSGVWYLSIKLLALAEEGLENLGYYLVHDVVPGIALKETD